MAMWVHSDFKETIMNSMALMLGGGVSDSKKSKKQKRGKKK